MKILIIILVVLIVSFIFPIFISETITIKYENNQSKSFIEVLSDIYTIVIQIWLVLTSIFIVFATLLPKVDDERQRHYNNINNDVLKRLSNISLNRSQDPLKFNSSINLPTDSIYYKPAVNHLKKDNPEFEFESTLKKLDKLLKENNEKANKLDSEINDLLEIEFRKGKTVNSEKLDINEGQVKRLILDCWNLFYRSLYLNPTNSIYNFRHYFPQSQFFVDNGRLCFRITSNNSFTPVVHNTTDFTPLSFEKKIDCIVKNANIIKLLQEIDQLQKNLNSIIMEVKHSIKNIPLLIENKEYRTSAKCCPGMFTLIFSYLK
jgi:hypothetical protein